MVVCVCTCTRRALSRVCIHVRMCIFVCMCLRIYLLCVSMYTFTHTYTYYTYIHTYECLCTCTRRAGPPPSPVRFTVRTCQCTCTCIYISYCSVLQICSVAVINSDHRSHQLTCTFSTESHTRGFTLLLDVCVYNTRVVTGSHPHLHTHTHTHTHSRDNCATSQDCVTHEHTNINTPSQTMAKSHRAPCICSVLWCVAVAKTHTTPYFCMLCLCTGPITSMGWLRLVGSLKLQFSFAKEPYKRDYILQKRPVILRSLLIGATP